MQYTVDHIRREWVGILSGLVILHLHQVKRGTLMNMVNDWLTDGLFVCKHPAANLRNFFQWVIYSWSFALLLHVFNTLAWYAIQIFLFHRIKRCVEIWTCYHTSYTIDSRHFYQTSGGPNLSLYLIQNCCDTIPIRLSSGLRFLEIQPNF